MKKSLIAMAILAAAGAVSAQSNVTLYGRLDLGMTRSKTTIGTTTTKTTDYFGNQHGYTTSRLGVKGSEDLGGGLKAGFQYEFKINPDVAPSVQNTRQANLSLSGGFGEVKIGTFDNSFDRTQGLMDWSYNWYGTYANIISGKSENALEYTTPDFGGLTASINLGKTKKTSTIGNQTTTNTDDTTTILGIDYATGPLKASLTYGQQKDGSVTPSKKKTDIAAAVNYTIANITPYLYVEQSKESGGDKLRSFELGASTTFGAANVWAAVATGKRKDVSGYTSEKLKNAFELGVAYDLSKRTYVYTWFGQDKKTTYATNGTATGTDKTTNLRAGVVHKF